MDKKPILYLSHCGSSIGGGEKQLAYLVANIDRARYCPLVVCPDDGVFVEHLRCAIFRQWFLRSRRGGKQDR